MSKYASCYDPPLAPDLLADREGAFANPEDRTLYSHIGYFIYWYASAELSLTLILRRFCGDPHPSHFHILTKGMDAKLKCERLKEAVKLAGCTIGEPLSKRIEHFTRRIASIRNQMVHSFIYFRDDTFQLTSLGVPPHDEEIPIKGAPKPEKIPSLEIYERGRWLSRFSLDLHDILETASTVLANKGTLGIIPYRSSLPTGDRPSPEKQARRASADKRPQTARGSK